MPDQVRHDGHYYETVSISFWPINRNCPPAVKLEVLSDDSSPARRASDYEFLPTTLTQLVKVWPTSADYKRGDYCRCNGMVCPHHPRFNAGKPGLVGSCRCQWDSEESRTSTKMMIAQGTGRKCSASVTSCKGFTLIEVLLVIAVIGILSAIAVPAYSAYMQKAKASAAVLAIGVIQKAIAAYFAETGTYPSSLADVGMDTMRDPWGHPYQYLRIAGATTTASSAGSQAAASAGSTSGGSSGSSGSGNSSATAGKSGSGNGKAGGDGTITGAGTNSGANASGASTTGGTSQAGSADLTGRVRKDHFMVPINTDYDLYSMGPDGMSASPLTANTSRDDIIRASDGAFVGRVCDF